MNVETVGLDRPAYDRGDRAMLRERAPLAVDFATLILDTVQPFSTVRREEMRILDVGCGYGHTAIELCRRCGYVIGIEPAGALFAHAEQMARRSGLANIEFRRQSVYQLDETSLYDLVVLDNVLEHLADQPLALRNIARSLKRGGVAFIVVPNKLWPLEVHHRLPFLSYLPLRVANAYLRFSGRGEDYMDASYAPTFWRLKRLLKMQDDLAFRFELPSDLSLTTQGKSLRYRLGAAMIRRWRSLWAISKAFLVVAVKT